MGAHPGVDTPRAGPATFASAGGSGPCGAKVEFIKSNFGIIHVRLGIIKPISHLYKPIPEFRDPNFDFFACGPVAVLLGKSTQTATQPGGQTHRVRAPGIHLGARRRPVPAHPALGAPRPGPVAVGSSGGRGPCRAHAQFINSDIEFIRSGCGPRAYL